MGVKTKSNKGTNNDGEKTTEFHPDTWNLQLQGGRCAGVSVTTHDETSGYFARHCVA